MKSRGYLTIYRKRWLQNPVNSSPTASMTSTAWTSSRLRKGDSCAATGVLRENARRASRRSRGLKYGGRFTTKKRNALQTACGAASLLSMSYISLKPTRLSGFRIAALFENCKGVLSHINTENLQV